MAIELLYDRGTLAVAPPPGCVPTVINKHAMPVLPDPVGAIEQALARPVERRRRCASWRAAAARPAS